MHERYRRQTTDRQTDGRTTTYSEHEHEFTFAKNWCKKNRKGGTQTCIANWGRLSCQSCSASITIPIMHQATNATTVQPPIHRHNFRNFPGLESGYPKFHEFPGPISGGCIWLVLRVQCIELNRILGGHRPIIGASRYCFMLLHSAYKKRVPQRPNLALFEPMWKLRID